MNDLENGKKVESGIYSKGEIDLKSIIKSIKQNPNIAEAGSIHTFTGIVRSTSKNWKPVVSKICEQLKQKEGIIDVKIIHLKGDFELTEDLVYVVVASAHRKEGFETISKAVELYKKEIAVWKREDFNDDSSEWVH